MINQKLENLLNLALEVEQSERIKSLNLGVGFSEETKEWELIVKYNGDISRLGGSIIKVEDLIAGYAIVTIPEILIDTFAELDEVEYIEKPKRLFFSILEGKRASCIFPVSVQSPYLTGSGTLIGIIDSGIDYRIPEFKNSDGKTRIQYLWDQTLTPETVNALISNKDSRFVGEASPPQGFRTGVEFNKYRIDVALESPNPERLVPSRDVSGHGTSVASIAAGSGNLGEGQYRGVAPESELIVVKLGNPLPGSFPKTTELMRALTYIVRKSVELGKPAAINLSFGNTYGAHDGSSLVERFMDNVSEMGRNVICVGSGNEGAAGGHVAGSFGRGGSGAESRLIELSVAPYQTAISVQLWKEYADRFVISLVSPSGKRETIDTLSPGKESFAIDETEILLFVGEPSPYSINQEIYFDFIPIGNYMNQGIWSFELTPIKTVTGNYDFYLPSEAVLNTGTRFFTPTPVKTLTIPSTAGKVITVAAYDVIYEAYADFSGRGYPMQSMVEERINAGNVKPDLAAPGVNIRTITEGGREAVVSGTSFATPFVTGSAALMMEWGIVKGNDPFLYGEKIKAYLRRGARPIRGEAVYPNERVGYGALCLADSLPSRL